MAGLRRCCCNKHNIFKGYMEIFRKACAIFGGTVSGCSGLLWYSSANLQLAVTHLPISSSNKLIKVMEISAQHNVWAAALAILAGSALATASYLE